MIHCCSLIGLGPGFDVDFAVVSKVYSKIVSREDGSAEEWKPAHCQYLHFARFPLPKDSSGIDICEDIRIVCQIRDHLVEEREVHSGNGGRRQGNIAREACIHDTFQLKVRLPR